MILLSAQQWTGCSRVLASQLLLADNEVFVPIISA